MYAGVVFSLLITTSCQKENVGGVTPNLNQEKQNTTTSNQRAQKFNVVHNGHTLEVSENAVLAHLQHGDKFGTIEDNVKFQSIILSQTPLASNDQTLIAFKNSINENSVEKVFEGNLKFEDANLLVLLNSTNIIAVPIASSDGSNTERKILFGILLPNNAFTSFVVKDQLKLEKEISIGNLFSSTFSGSFSFHKLNGEMEVLFSLTNNVINDIEIGLGGESCFKSCYARVRRECADSFPCSTFCEVPVSGGFFWTVGVAACCGLDCALTGQSQNC